MCIPNILNVTNYLLPQGWEEFQDMGHAIMYQLCHVKEDVCLLGHKRFWPTNKCDRGEHQFKRARYALGSGPHVLMWGRNHYRFACVHVHR